MVCAICGVPTSRYPWCTQEHRMEVAEKVRRAQAERDRRYTIDPEPPEPPPRKHEPHNYAGTDVDETITDYVISRLRL